MTEIIEISPEAKYAVLIESNLPAAEIGRVSQQLSEWWASDEKFIVLSGSVKLVRLDEGETTTD